MTTELFTRRQVLKYSTALGVGAGLGLMPGLSAVAQMNLDLRTRAIPSSGERLPLVGIGTARRYTVDVNDSAAMDPLREVVTFLPRVGGTMIDTAPSYGNAEQVLGLLINEQASRDALFLATKVRKDDLAGARDEIEQSFRLLRTDVIDLLQVHNLAAVREVLPYLRDLKAEGRIRYYGITTSFSGQYEAFKQILAGEELDFIQIDYAIDNREAGARILPMAQDRGVAVQTNLPFGRGRVFEAFGDQTIPDWAAEFDIHSWAQFALKWVVSNPAVTSAIPGTARLSYLVDNVGASYGRLPDAATRSRMAALIDSA